MNALIVARQHMKEQRLVWLAALLGSVACWVIPPLKGLHGTALAEARAGLAAVGGIGLALVLSLMLGAGLVAGDLVEGRLGFYLSRPLSPSALFGGKALGALLLVAGVLGVMWVPIAATHPRFIGEPAGLLALLAAVLLALLGAHAAAIAGRDRSAWTLLDLCVAGGSLVGGAWILWTCMALGTFEGMMRLFGFLVAGAILSLAVGGFVSVMVGRADLRRAHRALSLSLAAMALLTLVAARVGLWKELRFRLVDLKGPEFVKVAPRGPWFRAANLSPGMTPSGFDNGLLNLDTGEGFRINSRYQAFSADGRRAAWATWGSPLKGGQPELWVADLGPRKAHPRATGITTQAPVEDLALSADGGRVGLLAGGSLEVHDLDKGVLLGRQPLPAGNRAFTQLAFAGPDLLRAYVRPVQGMSDDGPIRIFELDLRTSRCSETGHLEGLQAPCVILGLSPSTTTLLAKSGPYEARVLTLHDGRSGAKLATLSRAPEKATASYLADGTILVTEAASETCLARHLDEQGQERRRWSLPWPGTRDPLLWLEGEPLAGKVVVAGRKGPAFELDLASGAQRAVEPSARAFRIEPVLGPAPLPGSPGARLTLKAGVGLAYRMPEGNLVPVQR